MYALGTGTWRLFLNSEWTMSTKAKRSRRKRSKTPQQRTPRSKASKSKATLIEEEMDNTRESLALAIGTLSHLYVFTCESELVQ